MNPSKQLPFTPRVYEAYSKFPQVYPNQSFDMSQLIRYGFHWALEPRFVERLSLKGRLPHACLDL